MELTWADVSSKKRNSLKRVYIAMAAIKCLIKEQMVEQKPIMVRVFYISAIYRSFSASIGWIEAVEPSQVLYDSSIIWPSPPSENDVIHRTRPKLVLSLFSALTYNNITRQKYAIKYERIITIAAANHQENRALLIRLWLGNQQLNFYIKVHRYRKNLIIAIGLKENHNCATDASIHQWQRHLYTA